MSSLPQTPVQKQLSVADTRVEDQSDDDSDIPHDGDKPPTSSDGLSRQEKAQDNEGAYTEEVDTGYSLFSNPPDLGSIRERLFDVKEEFEMTAGDFEIYFPFVDNVWRKQRLNDAPPDTEGTTETYCCRLKPSGQNKTPVPRAQTEGKQQRRKRKREEKTCPMVLKVTYVDSPVKKVKMSRLLGPEVTHTHDLDYMDMNKRNSAIMDVARREAVRAFLPGSIFWKMQEEPAKMEEAGGKFMKVSDVRNVQYPWRTLNMTAALKAHAGYSQQRSGPRSRPMGVVPVTPMNGVAQSQVQAQAYPAPPPNHTPRAAPAPPPPLPPGTLNYPEVAKEFLRPYLPFVPQIASQQRPHITLTWATSLDSRVALLPGVQTAISGPETKAMTHFLRSQHDAILIGVKTAIADDPGLNCRLAGAGGFGGYNRAMQPRPIIIDPHGKLHIHPNMRLLKAASEGKALGPWIVVGPGVKLHPQAVSTLKTHGGEYLQINEIHPHRGLDWEALFTIFHKEGIKSMMIEGGGTVLSELLSPRYTHCIDTVIITIAPTFFGKSGVQVSPDTTYDGNIAIQTRLIDVKWQPMGQSDMVLCAHLDKTRTRPQPPLPGIHDFSRQAQPPPQGSPHPQQAQPPSGYTHSPLQAQQTPASAPPQPQSQQPLPQTPVNVTQPQSVAESLQVNGHARTPSNVQSPKYRHYVPPTPR